MSTFDNWPYAGCPDCLVKLDVRDGDEPLFVCPDCGRGFENIVDTKPLVEGRDLPMPDEGEIQR